MGGWVGRKWVEDECGFFRREGRKEGKVLKGEGKEGNGNGLGMESRPKTRPDQARPGQPRHRTGKTRKEEFSGRVIADDRSSLYLSRKYQIHCS